MSVTVRLYLSNSSFILFLFTKCSNMRTARISGWRRKKVIVKYLAIIVSNWYLIYSYLSLKLITQIFHQFKDISFAFNFKPKKPLSLFDEFANSGWHVKVFRQILYIYIYIPWRFDRFLGLPLVGTCLQTFEKMVHVLYQKNNNLFILFSFFKIPMHLANRY